MASLIAIPWAGRSRGRSRPSSLSSPHLHPMSPSGLMELALRCWQTSHACYLLLPVEEPYISAVTSTLSPLRPAKTEPTMSSHRAPASPSLVPFPACDVLNLPFNLVLAARILHLASVTRCMQRHANRLSIDFSTMVHRMHAVIRLHGPKAIHARLPWPGLSGSYRCRVMAARNRSALLTGKCVCHSIYLLSFVIAILELHLETS